MNNIITKKENKPGSCWFFHRWRVVHCLRGLLVRECRKCESKITQYQIKDSDIVIEEENKVQIFEEIYCDDEVKTVRLYLTL